MFFETDIIETDIKSDKKKKSILKLKPRYRILKCKDSYFYPQKRFLLFFYIHLKYEDSDVNAVYTSQNGALNAIKRDYLKHNKNQLVIAEFDEPPDMLPDLRK